MPDFGEHVLQHAAHSVKTFTQIQTLLAGYDTREAPPTSMASLYLSKPLKETPTTLQKPSKFLGQFERKAWQYLFRGWVATVSNGFNIKKL